jgi:FecR protein
MKRVQTIAAYLMVLAVAIVSSLKAAEPGRIQGHATVRTVHGTASFSFGGQSQVLKPGMMLDPGVTITTGPDSYIYLNINGSMSAVRVSADTTLILEKMDRIGSGREGDTETMLNIQAGSILGQVQKVGANSRYEITTPHGVAGIRGTDWSVVVTALANGQFEVTFESVQGTLVASAVVNGALQTKTLNGGESWTVGADVVPVQIQLLQWQLDQINLMISEITAGITPAVSPLGVVIIQPFNGGPEPGQAPASGAVPPTPTPNPYTPPPPSDGQKK